MKEIIPDFIKNSLSLIVDVTSPSFDFHQSVNNDASLNDNYLKFQFNSPCARYNSEF